jgi:hypothetical protein
MQRTIALCVLLAACGSAVADTIVLNASSRGQIDSSNNILGGTPTSDYTVGMPASSSYDDYFIFNLAGITKQVTGGKLTVYNPPNGTAASSLQYLIYSANTTSSGTLATLTSSSYNQHTYSTADNGPYLTIDLGPKFNISANQSLGGYIGMWGTVSPSNNYLLANSAGLPASDVQLTLTLVPEPASLSVLAMGVVLLMRRRSA